MTEYYSNLFEDVVDAIVAHAETLDDVTDDIIYGAIHKVIDNMFIYYHEPTRYLLEETTIDDALVAWRAAFGDTCPRDSGQLAYVACEREFNERYTKDEILEAVSSQVGEI